jgi:hypothetical protein
MVSVFDCCQWAGARLWSQRLALFVDRDVRVRSPIPQRSALSACPQNFVVPGLVTRQSPPAASRSRGVHFLLSLRQTSDSLLDLYSNTDSVTYRVCTNDLSKFGVRLRKLIGPISETNRVVFL